MNEYIPPFGEFTPCYQCPERHPRCHGDCLRYAKYRRKLDEMRPKKVDITTEAQEKNIKNALRQTVKSRMDGRGKHKTGD